MLHNPYSGTRPDGLKAVPEDLINKPIGPYDIVITRIIITPHTYGLPLSYLDNDIYHPRRGTRARA